MEENTVVEIIEVPEPVVTFKKKYFVYAAVAVAAVASIVYIRTKMNADADDFVNSETTDSTTA